MVRTVKKAEERKSEIIQAARFLFQTREYDKTTMQDLIEHLGIAKGTVYYYFKSKEELLEAVIEALVDENLDQMQKLLDETSGNALEKLEALISAGNIADENETLLAQAHQPGNMGMHTRLLAAAIQKQAPLYARLIQQGCEEGLFDTDSPLETAEFILSATQFLTDQGIYPWSQETLSRRIKALPSLLEAQLKALPGSFQFLLSQLPDDGDIQ